MPDITNIKSVAITSLLSNLDLYKYNPSAIQRVMFDYLEEVTDGKVDIVDPTNPFVFLIEASAVNTALAITENTLNLRRLYPSLSQTEEDIYLHMADKDFVSRFATPCSATFTLTLQVNDTNNKMPYNEEQQCFMLTIARDTMFVVDGIPFTLQYPIDIKRYENGVVQLSYNTDITSPLETITSNIIDYTVRRDQSLIDWIFFEIPVKQFMIEPTYFTIQKSSLFSDFIRFSNKFYFARVFYKNNATLNTWKELLVTYTDQVFDPLKPTAVIKVYSGQLELIIPSIYTTTGMISGELRIDVYTTLGKVALNLRNYKPASFITTLRAIDDVRDVSDYTVAMNDVSYYAYSSDIISGGTDGIDFTTLRERVINNSIGDRQLPITNNQLTAHVNNSGFDLIKNVDVITNRIFLATQRLPDPINNKLLTAANIGIGTVVVNIEKLKTHSAVANNDYRITVLPDNLFINENGQIRLLNSTESSVINTMSKVDLVNDVNSKQYLYTPFHYVLDGSKNEFEVRVYNLNFPTAYNLSFIRQNETMQLPVNTAAYYLEKIASGFKLTLTTKSGNFYKALKDDQLNFQLAYYPVGETNLAYINGYIENLNNLQDERFISFNINTNYDFDSNNNICITNGRMFNSQTIKTWVKLDQLFYIFYTSTSLTENYKPNLTDQSIGKFLLPEGSASITEESLSLRLGTNLKNLWSRSRTFATGLEYERYTVDQPMFYTEDVFDIDPATGSIFKINTSGELEYLIKHKLGDPVLDESGSQIFKNRKGDVVIGDNGKPVILADIRSDKEVDFLFVDGRYYFTTELAYNDYKKELTAIIDKWITVDVSGLQNILLEQSKIFFYPKTTLGMVKVYPDENGEDFITSEQSLVIDLYVRNNVFINLQLRNNLIENTIKVLDSYVSKTIVNLTEIIIALKQLYIDTVVGVNITNLGGIKNYNVVALAAEHNKLCLKKKLVLQQDGSIIVKEDVVINFLNVERN